MLQILTTNHYNGRAGYSPKWLILHATAGGSSAQAIAQYFISTEGTSNPVSSNYIIGQDGSVVMSVQESDSAWSNGILSAGHDPWWSNAINPNYQTISIEHVKPSTDNSDALTLAQQLASFKLVADICHRWNIPMHEADDQGGITGHYSIDPVSRSNCPGPYPWDALWSYLKGLPMQTIPQGWSYDANTQVLRAPNGHTVHLGMAQFVLAKAGGWNPANMPLEEEHGTGTAGNTVQLFRDCQLAWDAKNGVYYAPLGQAYQVALAQANTTVQQITSKIQTVAVTLSQHVTALQLDEAALTAAIAPPSS